MRQKSYIKHCLKNNDMAQMKVVRSLPCVDEKTPPEDPYDADGYPTSFEEDKSHAPEIDRPTNPVDHKN